ncbi:glycerate kinase type-2 family protein [Phaeovulum vinaykumarii]|nr:DUF4147 domain-containing protein [Phaeovulum vinaykumarii]
MTDAVPAPPRPAIAPFHETPAARRALALFGAGLAAADPGPAVVAAMADVVEDPPGPGGRWQVIALGKAARAMTAAALAALPAGTPALVVTNHENAAPLAGARVMGAGHPVPDAAGLAAATEIETALRTLGPEDRLLALISGGGSALAPAPVAGLSLDDKAAVNRLLLGAGADISQMNLVRQALSRLKGGGWLRICRAPGVALMISDVPGDDLRVIASGPTVAPLGTPAQAAQLCRDVGLWERLPEPARNALAAPPPPPVPARAFRNLLVGSNARSLAAMAAAGATTAPFALAGDVADAARVLAAALTGLAPGAALAAGGETTVRLTGTGTGGRNQELALRTALHLAETGPPEGDWAVLVAGSDGRDGPTEAAGAIITPGTLGRIRAAGLDLRAVLFRNDSTPALTAGQALLVTGPTGTNVADLAVLVRGAAPG